MGCKVHGCERSNNNRTDGHAALPVMRLLVASNAFVWSYIYRRHTRSPIHTHIERAARLAITTLLPSIIIVEGNLPSVRDSRTPNAVSVTFHGLLFECTGNGFRTACIYRVVNVNILMDIFVGGINDFFLLGGVLKCSIDSLINLK